MHDYDLDMMKRSFYEDENQRDIPEQQLQMKRHEEQLNASENLNCTICSDMDEFYQV